MNSSSRRDVRFGKLCFHLCHSLDNFKRILGAKQDCVRIAIPTLKKLVVKFRKLTMKCSQWCSFLSSKPERVERRPFQETCVRVCAQLLEKRGAAHARIAPESPPLQKVVSTMSQNDCHTYFLEEAGWPESFFFSHSVAPVRLSG